MAERDDRTEAPTAKRLNRAREAGQAPVSRELVAFATLGAAAIAMAWLADTATARLAGRLRPLLEMSAPPGQAATSAAWAAATFLAPFLAIGAVVGVGSVLAQSGLLVHPAALAPDLARISPARGLRRLFGTANAIEAAKASVKLAVLGWAARRALTDSLPILAAASSTTPQALAAGLSRATLGVAMPVLAAQAGIAALDVAWQRMRHARSLRMSRQEVKDEARETEGDPRVKARLRHIRLARARGRMMQAVPNATVVVTNPTHYAVALTFDRATQAAPRVVAKGADEVAARIRALAKSHGVPMVADPPLARALFRSELDTEIPAEHFQAVAEIIAYVWRLGGKRAGVRG